MNRFAVSAHEIDAAGETVALSNPKAGALVTFEGWIRNHTEGLAVTRLEYEVFDTLAISEGELIINEAISRFGIHGARCVHRSGALQIGELAVWVGVTASHRDAAFRAARYIIDEIKTRLPIWKHEFYGDGRAEWVNCQSHAPHGQYKAFDEAMFYDRQIRLSEIGKAGQEKLKASSVLIVGVGGLGASAAQALAGAGVGRLTLCDFDRLSANNLHRQFLYAFDDVGKPKAELAVERLRQSNPFIQIAARSERFTVGSAEKLLEGCSVVLDCTDNLEAKFALNDACAKAKIPLVSAAVHKFEGELLVVAPRGTGGCLRCLWPELDVTSRADTCSEAGVIGTLPALLGSMQALEAIKLILGIKSPALDHLILFDGISLQTSLVKRQCDTGCNVCGCKSAVQEKKIA